MPKDVVFINQPTSKKRKVPAGDTVKLSDIVTLDFFVRGKAKVFLKDGTRVTVSAALAEAFCDKHKIWNMPKGYSDKDIRFDVKADDIKNILFRYQRVSRVRLKTGTETFVPRAVSDLFQETEADYLTRNVDQPWNDRTIHDIPLSDIFKVVRLSKHCARVMTTDMVMRLVSVERANAFLRNEKLVGEEELAEFGISLVKAPERKTDAPKKVPAKKAPAPKGRTR